MLNIADSGLDMTMFANDLFNETDVFDSVNFVPELTFVAAIYGPVRMYGLELRFHF